MKKLFAFLLCGVILCGLAACGESPVPADSDSSASSGAVSDSATGDSVASSDEVDASDTSDEEEVKIPVFDPAVDHKIIMDVSARGILVVDLDETGDHPENWSVEDGIIWEWSTDDLAEGKMKGVSVTMDSARLRYSPYYESDVIVFCGSGGWVGVVDYATKELLFEDNPGKGPHSAELLPNGDLVLACSGNSNSEEGCVLYYPLSSGLTRSTSTYPLISAHGVCYDPEQDVIWALGGYEIVALSVSGKGTEKAKISPVNGMGVKLPSNGGHELSPAYGHPGKYWVSGGKEVWVFDSVEGTISATDLQAKKYTNKNVKGMAYFSDGTMVQTSHDQGGTGTYRSSLFRVMYLAESSGKIKTSVVKELMIPHAGDYQSYKVDVFCKDYQ